MHIKQSSARRKAHLRNQQWRTKANTQHNRLHKGRPNFYKQGYDLQYTADHMVSGQLLQLSMGASMSLILLIDNLKVFCLCCRTFNLAILWTSLKTKWPKYTDLLFNCRTSGHKRSNSGPPEKKVILPGTGWNCNRSTAETGGLCPYFGTFSQTTKWHEL